MKDIPPPKDFHESDFVYGNGDKSKSPGNMSMVSEPEPRKSKRKRIEVAANTSVYRVSPSGERQFVLQTDKNKVTVTIKVWEGDKVSCKKHDKKY